MYVVSLIVLGIVFILVSEIIQLRNKLVTEKQKVVEISKHLKEAKKLRIENISSRCFYAQHLIQEYLRWHDMPAVLKCIREFEYLLSALPKGAERTLVEKIFCGCGTRDDWAELLIIAPTDSGPMTLAYIVCEWGTSTWEHMSFLAARNPTRMMESVILESMTKSQYWIDLDISKIHAHKAA